MERPSALSTRSPNRPNPHSSSSILRRTLKTPATIRKANGAATIATSVASTLKSSSPGKSPTRERPSTSVDDTAKTPRPRPISMVETTSKTVRANPPNTIQRVQQMFNIPSQDPLETPIRPTPQHQHPKNDLLISFETPCPNAPLIPSATGRPRSLLELDLDDLLTGPTPHQSHPNKPDANLASQISAALESEREKWIKEAEVRHMADLEALAADLHSQYREKHTRKVEALKATYKRQYEKKISGLEERITELEGVVEGLREELDREKREKRELIEMSEELMRLTSGGD